MTFHDSSSRRGIRTASQSLASSSKSRPVARLLMAAGFASLLGGCGSYDYLNLRNSFLNPAEVGRFDKENPFGTGEVRPVKWPILSQLDVIEEPSNKWANAIDPTPADLIPEVKEYAMQAGDAINVSIYELITPGMEYTRQLRVNELGYVNLQTIGNIHVAGLTPTQLEQKISQILVEQKILPAQPGPQVSVTLLESRTKVFSVLGSIGKPGTYTILSNDFRLLDAIAMVGDIPVQPGLDYVYVIRQGIHDDAASAPTTSPNGSGLMPQPGGTAPGAVPGRSPADELNALEQGVQTMPQTAPTTPTTPASGPGAKGLAFVRPLPTAMVLAQADLDAALALPGASTLPITTVPASVPATDRALLDQGAATSQPGAQVYVDGKWNPIPTTQTATIPTASLPGDTGTMPAETMEGQQRVIRIPLAPLREGVSKYNIVIRPGDLINVPPVEQGEFYMMGNIGRPGVYSITGRKITLKQAVAAAGNLGPLAIPRRCDLIRRIGEDQEAIIQVNLQKIFDGEQPDIFLKANDVVNIGTDAIAPFLAVTRNAYRASYGWGFVYDKNLNDDANTNNGGF